MRMVAPIFVLFVPLATMRAQPRAMRILLLAIVLSLLPWGELSAQIPQEEQRPLLEVPLMERPLTLESRKDAEKLLARILASKEQATGLPEGEPRTALLEIIGRQEVAVGNLISDFAMRAGRAQRIQDLEQQITETERDAIAARETLRSRQERYAQDPRSALGTVTGLEEMRAELASAQARQGELSQREQDAVSAVDHVRTALAGITENLPRRKEELAHSQALVEEQTRQAVAAETQGIGRMELLQVRATAYAMRLELMASVASIATDEWRVSEELPRRQKLAEAALEVAKTQSSGQQELTGAIERVVGQEAEREARGRSLTAAEVQRQLDEGAPPEVAPRLRLELATLKIKEELEDARSLKPPPSRPRLMLPQAQAFDRLGVDADRLRENQILQEAEVLQMEEQLQELRSRLTKAREHRHALEVAQTDSEELIRDGLEQTEEALKSQTFQPFQINQVRSAWDESAVRLKGAIKDWDTVLVDAASSIDGQFTALDKELVDRRERLAGLKRRLFWLQDESRISTDSLVQAGKNLAGFPSEAASRIDSTLSNWKEKLSEESNRHRAILTGIVLLLSIGLLLLVHRKLPVTLSWLESHDGATPGFWTLVAAALRRSEFVSMVALLFCALCALWHVWPWETGLLAVVVLTPCFYRLGKVTLDLMLQPDNPNQRVVPLENSVAQAIHRSLIWLLRVSLIFVPLGLALKLIGYDAQNPGFLQAWWFIYALLMAGFMLFGVCRPTVVRQLIQGQSQWAASVRTLVWMMYPLILLVTFFLLFLRAFRYQQAFTYFREHLLVTLLSIAGAYLLYRWLLKRLNPKGDYHRSLNSDDYDTSDQLEAAGRNLFWDRIARMGVRLLILLPVLLILLGYWSDLETSFLDVSLFGEGSLTTREILKGALVLLITTTVVRHFRRGMRYVLLPGTSLEQGIRYAILTLTSYALMAIGLVVCLNVVHVKGDQIAYVLSALMVGIGFGLKDIVTNFVSGIILLIERPLKVGDQIELGDQSGVVENINLRSTTIMTFDSVGVVVPNADLVSGTLVNRSAGPPIMRTTVQVGVGYDSDVRQVFKVLQEVLEGHGLVLKKPAPMVVFDGFGDSSLDFSLRYWSRMSESRLRISSDVRSSILASLRKNEIEIPFPKRDLHVTFDETPPEELTDAGDGQEVLPEATS